MKRTITLLSKQNYPKYFTKDHKWLQEVPDSHMKSRNYEGEGTVVRIGISKHLSSTKILPENIVYLGTEVIEDMAERKEEVKINEELLEMEVVADSEYGGVKPIEAIRSPIGGVILSVNQKLKEGSENFEKNRREFGDVLKNDPENQGYICELEIKSKTEIEHLLERKYLVTENDYLKLLAENRKEHEEKLKKSNLKK